MRATTCMHPSAVSSKSPVSTAERLLDAATVVIARMGVGKATTREIAKEAGVNEVTLFRVFQNKQGLMSAVLERAFLPSTDLRVQPGLTVDGGMSLREILMGFATEDFERKRRNIALMRVLVGEVRGLGSQEAEVLRRIFKPWKDEMVARLEEARALGMVREDVDLVIVVDQLVAMIFVGALRADALKCMEYTPQEYLAASVELVARAIGNEAGRGGAA